LVHQKLWISSFIVFDMEVEKKTYLIDFIPLVVLLAKIHEILFMNCCD